MLFGVIKRLLRLLTKSIFQIGFVIQPFIFPTDAQKKSSFRDLISKIAHILMLMPHFENIKIFHFSK